MAQRLDLALTIGENMLRISSGRRLCIAKYVGNIYLHKLMLYKNMQHENGVQ